MSTEPESASAGVILWIRSYARNLIEILLNPTRFFRSVNLNRPLHGPLAFALITHWLGAAIAHLWQGVYRNLFSEVSTFFTNGFHFAEDVMELKKSRGADFFNQIQNQWLPLWVEWSRKIEMVLLDPFFTLIKIGIYSLFLLLGARILLKSKHYSHRSLIMVLSYSYAPSVLMALPLFGGFIGKVYGLILLTIGIRELARAPEEPIGTARAALVATFPILLFYSLIFFIIAFVVIGVLTLIGAFFWKSF